LGEIILSALVPGLLLFENQPRRFAAQPEGENMETVVLPSESVQKLLALAHHAIMLDKWLGENLGHNDEWPMQLIASTETDEAAAEEVSKMLSAMGLAGREVKADGECMRQIMRWQIETYGNPYGGVNELL